MTVEWSQPVFPNGIVDFYVVSFCNGSIPIETKGTNDHSYTLQGLLPAWQYAVTVKAHTNSYGNISKLTAVTLGGVYVYVTIRFLRNDLFLVFPTKCDILNDMYHDTALANLAVTNYD